jgi:hypothetical protein
VAEYGQERRGCRGCALHRAPLSPACASSGVLEPSALRCPTAYHCAALRCAGHVTFFWNGNRSGYLDPKLEKFEEVRGADVALAWR